MVAGRRFQLARSRRGREILPLRTPQGRRSPPPPQWSARARWSVRWIRAALGVADGPGAGVAANRDAAAGEGRRLLARMEGLEEHARACEGGEVGAERGFGVAGGPAGGFD